MNILVVNDDGIDSPGIRELVRLAGGLGEVTVVAPMGVQSGASHRITIDWPVDVQVRTDFPRAQAAYAVDGTPADCALLGVGCLCETVPDLVLSGINSGLNVGFDVLYSGTVAAAMEAAVRGVPAVAFSLTRSARDFCAVEANFRAIMDELLARPARTDGVWNVNVPGCPAERVRGVLYDRVPALRDLRPVMGYVRGEPTHVDRGDFPLDDAGEDGSGPAEGLSSGSGGAEGPRALVAEEFSLRPVLDQVDVDAWARELENDMGAVCANYISVGWVPSMVG